MEVGNLEPCSRQLYEPFLTSFFFFLCLFLSLFSIPFPPSLSVLHIANIHSLCLLDTSTMSRLVIRVNSDFLIDGRPETSDPIQAVVCSLSHPVFSSTKIRLFGPLGATIPLRELRVTTDEDVASITVTPEQRMLQPWLAGSRRATYYTPYLPRDLTKPQFKVMVVPSLCEG